MLSLEKARVSACAIALAFAAAVCFPAVAEQPDLATAQGAIATPVWFDASEAVWADPYGPNLSIGRLVDARRLASVYQQHAPAQISQSAWAGPAKFFTINQVLASRGAPPSTSHPTRVASIEPTKTMTDASPTDATTVDAHEPFGLATFKAPNRVLWAKWHGVEADIAAEQPSLKHCRDEDSACSPAAARFNSIIRRAEKLETRAKLEWVNEQVNAAIRYTSDWTQWGAADVWSAPLAQGKGSFETGKGDCEDYAIAKYVALREAGMTDSNLRIVLVRDTAARVDHAVLTARLDGRWLILDNRFSRLLDADEARAFLPLFSIDNTGVKLFAAPYAQSRARQDLAFGDSQDAEVITGTGDETPTFARIGLPLLL
jgi:predicted transglutaminase-like cysteine proteinase